MPVTWPLHSSSIGWLVSQAASGSSRWSDQECTQRHLSLWPFRGNQACPAGLFLLLPLLLLRERDSILPNYYYLSVVCEKNTFCFYQFSLFKWFASPHRKHKVLVLLFVSMWVIILWNCSFFKSQITWEFLNFILLIWQTWTGAEWQNRGVSVLRSSLSQSCFWQPGITDLHNCQQRSGETLGSALHLHLLGTWRI